MIDLLRQFHALRSTLGVTVENALAVTHNLPDHNHSQEEVRRILVRVRHFRSLKLVITKKCLLPLCSFPPYVSPPLRNVVFHAPVTDRQDGFPEPIREEMP